MTDGRTPVPRVAWHRPMNGRDPDEAHRASTPLELFFDLCFVVAVSAAAASLHHDLSRDHLVGLVGYGSVFFAIWWAWVNYSWFASAYDTGDVSFQMTTFVVMAGVLVLAAGVPRAAGDAHDFRVLVLGYVIMRIALVPLWIRVAREHLEGRATALRYAAGVAVTQVLWVLRTLFFGHDAFGWVVFAALVVLELATPYWAERASGGTPWHRHHIAERYEAFTIIVLGEVVLATSGAIATSLGGHGLDLQLFWLILGALVLVFSLWWVYFKVPMVDSLSPGTAFAFGYAHYLVFASLAAVGACLAMLVEVVDHEAEVSARTALLLLVTAISTYLVSLSVVHGLRDARPLAAVPAALTIAAMYAVVLIGLPTGVTVLAIGAVHAGGLVNALWRATHAA